MTPKERQVYRSLGERYLKTRRAKDMNGNLNLPVEDFLVEIGKLHIFNETLGKQLNAANRRVAELTAQNLKLGQRIADLENPATPQLPTPAQVEEDVNKALAANHTSQPA
jgi:hypothetical protein